MGKKIRKALMKKACKIYAANIVSNAMGCGAQSDLFNNIDEEAYFQEELQNIANRISTISARSLDESIILANNKQFK